MTTQQTKTNKVKTASCILLNILASICRFESFTWIPIQILYIHGHFKLRNMKLHVLTIKLTHWAWAVCGRTRVQREFLLRTSVTYSLPCHASCQVKYFGKYSEGSERFRWESTKRQCSFIFPTLPLAAPSFNSCGSLWITEHNRWHLVTRRQYVPKRPGYQL